MLAHVKVEYCNLGDQKMYILDFGLVLIEQFTDYGSNNIHDAAIEKTKFWLEKSNLTFAISGVTVNPVIFHSPIIRTMQQ